MIESIKAMQGFRSRVKPSNIANSELFFMSSTALSGVTVPSGVLVFDTTSKVLKYGIGSTTLRTISYT